MNAQQLRSAILQQAIEGKLVPQLDSEPAVEQIGDAPEKVAFAIPDKWKWVRLENVISIKSGDNLTKSKYIHGNIPVYGGNGINGYHNASNVDEETLIIGRVGFYCGNVQKTSTKAWVTDNALIVGLKINANVDYLLFMLNALELGKQTSQTAQPVITGKIIKPIFAPIPPVDEQRRIVAKLDELLPLVEEYGKSQEILDRLNEEIGGKLRSSILQEAIQGKLVSQLDSEPAVEQIGEALEDVPFAIPDKWKWVQLKKIANPTEQKVPNKEFTYIDVASISNFRIVSPKKLSANEAPSRARKIVTKGMLLYSTVRPYLMNVCIANDIKGETIASTAFATFTCSEVALEKYVFFVLVSPYFTGYAKRVQKGVSYPAINDKDFYSAWIPLPPLDEQRRIVAKVESLLKEVDSIVG